MFLHRSPAGLVAYAPAKLNLFLEVLGRRADGYHELETLIYPVGLFDTLRFRQANGNGVSFYYHFGCAKHRAESIGLQKVPSGEENLVVRAVRELQRAAGVERGCVIEMVKRTPTQAGLGGGSSDAAAALALCNAGWNLRWPTARLAEVGATLGSDVPAMLVGGAVVCRGRGEVVEPVPSASSLVFVIARPPVGLPTHQVFRACSVASSPRRVGPLIDALRRGDLAAVGRLLFNRLEEAAGKISGWIAQLRHQLERLQCFGCSMTGSGSCLFALCRNVRHAHRVARQLEATGSAVAMVARGTL